jgi:hypothetical protein
MYRFAENGRNMFMLALLLINITIVKNNSVVKILCGINLSMGRNH